MKKRNIIWYARMLFVALWFPLVCIIVLPITLIRFKNTANNVLLIRLLVSLGRKVLGLKVEHRRRDIVDNNQPCIFVMNHQASLDVLSNAEMYPDKCVLIAKRPLLLIPIFGWILYLSGNILINKKSNSHSIKKLNVADKAIIEKKLSIWIFPEGTRSYNKGLGKLKKGAFYLAIKNQVPIVPVVVSNYYKNIDFNKKFAGKILIEALEPILVQGKTIESLPEIMQQTETAMRQGIEKLDAEIAAQL